MSVNGLRYETQPTSSPKVGVFSRRILSEKTTRDWLKWSQAIVDSAALTLEAIESENADQVLAAGEAIYNTCVGCHGGYWRMSSP